MMLALLHLFGVLVANRFKSRRWLEIENLYLRHQLNIAMGRTAHRLRLRGTDRALLVWMTWLWPSLLGLSRVVQPDTILRLASSRVSSLLALEIPWPTGSAPDYPRAARIHSTDHYGAVVAAFDQNQKIDWFGTLRQRFGVLVTPDLLVYGSYGAAIAGISTAGNVFGFDPNGIPAISAFSNRSINAGWAAGGGVEAHLGGHWTGKVEYLYMEFGSATTNMNNHDPDHAVQLPHHRSASTRGPQLQIRSVRNGLRRAGRQRPDLRQGADRDGLELGRALSRRQLRLRLGQIRHAGVADRADGLLPRRTRDRCRARRCSRAFPSLRSLRWRPAPPMRSTAPGPARQTSGRMARIGARPRMCRTTRRRSPTTALRPR